MEHRATSLRRVGLTGGIASGKSELRQLLAGHGALTIDADAVYHELLQSDPTLGQALAARFGPSVLAAGRVDRAALARLVLGPAPAQRQAQAALAALTHPPIMDEVWRRAELLAAAAPVAPHPAVLVVEAALLVESGAWRDFEAVIVVTTPAALRLARLLGRGGLTEAEARARLAAQATEAERAARATWIVDNRASRAALVRAAADLWPRLIAARWPPPGPADHHS